MKLIVTADDYGKSECVNLAIEACLERQVLAATCVMTNMPNAEDAGKLRQRYPGISLGIHWNITEGRPTLPETKVASLTDRAGNFFKLKELRRKWIRRKIDRGQVRSELREQYRKFREIAGEADFWNSHQDSHLYPGLFQLFVQTAGELGISSMRCHRRIPLPPVSTGTFYLRNPLYWLKGLLINRWSQKAERQGFLMPLGLVHMPDYSGSTKSLLELVCRLDRLGTSQTVELVVHPTLDPKETSLGFVPERRFLEYQTFSDAKTYGLFRESPIQTGGFDLLRAS